MKRQQNASNTSRVTNYPKGAYLCVILVLAETTAGASSFSSSFSSSSQTDAATMTAAITTAAADADKAD